MTQLGTELPLALPTRPPLGGVVSLPLSEVVELASYSCVGVAGSSADVWNISTIALRPAFSVSTSLFSESISLIAPSSLD